LDLGGPQRSLVLAMLLVHANTVVSVDRLVDALWGEAPPRSCRVQLQGLVSDLRRRLASGRERAAAPNPHPYFRLCGAGGAGAA
jgi:DNA-binding SARP family transcriptional activator